MQNRPTAVLELSIGISIRIKLSKLKVSRHYTLDLPFPIFRLQTSHIEKGYISLCLYFPSCLFTNLIVLRALTKKVQVIPFDYYEKC